MSTEFASLEEARLRSSIPEVAAEFIEVVGSIAGFAGIMDWATTGNLDCLDRSPSEHDVEIIERFFFDRGSDAKLSVPHPASEQTVKLLAGRGWHWAASENVLGVELQSLPKVTDDSLIRPDTPAESVEITMSVFTDEKEDSNVRLANAASTIIFVAEVDGELAGQGLMSRRGELAGLFSGIVREPFRGRGVQRSLMLHRLHHARSIGCTMASVACEATSPSASNAAALGVNLRYVRNAMKKRRPA